MRHYLVLARKRSFVRDRVPIGLAFTTDVVEAAVALASASGFGWIDAFEIADDRLDGSREAVEIEPVETRLCRRMHVRIVARAKPFDEVQHVVIAPHPRRETAEVGEGSVGTGIVRETQHVAIHAIASGQSPSTATAVKPRSWMRRRVMRARSR